MVTTRTGASHDVPTADALHSSEAIVYADRELVLTLVSKIANENGELMRRLA